MAPDGAMFFVRQLGDTVWASGMSDAPEKYGDMGSDWHSVAKGALTGTRLQMEYADVPFGNIWSDGTLSAILEADPDGNLQARRTDGDFAGAIMRPCANEPVAVSQFPRPFSYTIPFGVGSGKARGSVDQTVLYPADIPNQGLTFWDIGPGLAVHCSLPEGAAPPTDWSPQAIVEHLRTIPGLEVGEPEETTVGGLPALKVEIAGTPGAAGCGGDGYVRFWKESGNEGGVGAGQRSQLHLVNVDGVTFVAEAWGDAPERWWPLAQRIVDSIEFDRDGELLDAVGEPAADGARIVKVDIVDERTRDLTIESPSVGYARVRLLLPDGFDEGGASRSWPTLYLLHGAWDDYTSWTRETDVEDIPELRDVLVVMPDAGQFGWYSDWTNGGAGGQPAWETFHTVELPELIEANWGGGPDRVVAGLSMGGFGALSYAARHPDMFEAAAAYSAVVDTLGSDFEAEPLMWGDKGSDPAWEEHNPLSQAAALEGTDLYISYGDGAPGPLDAPGAAADDLESWLAPQNDRLVARLEELGIPATVDAYGHGTHTWPYWERGLHESLPVLLGALEG
jgi:S-formylglutathione hydrolase FrmB